MSDRGKARIGSSLPAMALFATFAVFSVREGSPQSCTPGSFSSALVRAVTYEPRDVAIADFDRDGRLDLALSLKAQSPTQDRLTVLWGDGAGGFDATPSTILLGVDDDPRALAVGDFDGNGTPDIAVALRGINRVQPVLKSTAGRTFALGTSYQPLQTETDRLVAADVDRDGTLDLVSSGRSAGFTFSRNNGSGAFSNATGASTAGPLAGLAVADFNRDGHPDVALAREGSPGEIALYRNDGSAGWPGEQAFPLPAAGGRPTALASSDVNRDGAQDLVASTDGTQVVALLGDGNAGFPTVKESLVQDPQTDLVLADFDRDGRIDVAVAQPTTRVIRIGFGRDDGTFAAAAPIAAEQQELVLAAADFDKDGRSDLAGAAALPANAATLRRNTFGIACQSVSLARAGRLHPLPNRATAIASGDWNGDGIPDVATAQDLSVSILTSDGKLGFSSASLTLPASGNPKGIAVADFDQDGDPDLAVTTQITSVLLYRNTAGVMTSVGSLLLPTTAYAPVTGDWNGDGAPDVVTINRLDTSLSFFRGAGDFSFGAPLTTPIGFGAMSAVAAADVDGDSHLDVVVASDANDVVRWYKGDGAGGFTLGGVGDMAVGDFPTSVAAADLNGDGKPDLAVANSLGDNVTVLLNLGGGSFGAATAFPAGDGPRSISVNDANGDGRPDIVVANTNSHDVTVLLGDGAGGFPAARKVPGHNTPEAALLVDADRNGKLDLVVTSSPATTGGNVAVFPGDGLGNFGPYQLAGGDSVDLATGDFDRDGRTDIVALHDGSSNLAYYRGNGDGSFTAPVEFPVGFPGIPNNLGIGDFDRDGDLDVFVTNSGSAVALLLGNGLGGFVAQPWVQITSAFSTSSNYGVTVGDFDRDGALDVAKANITDASVTVLFGNGAGGFVATQFTLSVGAGSNPTSIVALDYNKDGILDLAVSIFNQNTIVLLSGSGIRATPFSLSSSFATGASTAPTGLATGDFDGDGNPDLAAAFLGGAPSRIAYFRGNGGGLGAQVTYPLGDPGDVDADGIAAADMDGDGKLDLLVACRGGAARDRFSVHVLRGTGSSVAGSAFLAADVWTVAKREPGHIALGDFDGDAKPDFVVGGINGTATDTIPVVLNSNCQPRRLRLTRQLSQCGIPGTPFAAQPAVQVEDDGANPIQCDASPITASLIAGSGGTLLGQTSLMPTSGVSDWATLPGANQLRIDTAGKKLQLGFAHGAAGQSYSRTFSLSPPLTISGPAAYCSGAGALYSADPGFDTYRWLIDGVGPASFLSELTLAPGALSAGGHNVRVDATADTCPATFNQPFSVVPDLTSVSLTPPGPLSLCTSCSGGTLTVSELGGGTVTRKWGYRTTSGSGPLIYIQGETAATYVLSGADFPGQGTYYVLSESTPQCGLVTQSSNEVQVVVTDSTGSPEEIPVLTARSTHQLNRLEWIYPAGHGTVAIRYNNAPTWAGCTPPATVAEGIADIPDQTGTAGGKGSFDHTTSLALPLQNDTTYCYSLFAETSPGVYSTLARSIRGRPFDTTLSRVKWAFSTGTSTLEPPGLGAGVLHVVSNDERLYAMEKGAGGGSWPPAFTPFKATGPSQARPVSVPIPVGPASRVIFLGSQSTVGNNSVAVDSDTGQGLWGQPLGAPVQGGPGGMFTAYSGSLDAIFFGTRDGSGTNALHARDPETGTSLAGWPYTGEAANRIGVISTQPTVDYAGNRVFFTSHRFAAGNDVAWCVNLATAARCAGWAAGVTGPLGNIEASAVLRSGRLYVSPIVAPDGTLEPLDAGTGSRLWGTPFAPGDGPIKLFAIADMFSNDLYLSTSTSVWAITDAGGSFSPKWSAPLAQPSQPVFFAGTGRVYVGDGNGRLHVLSAASGADLVPPIVLGEPGFAVAGAPTVDQAGGFVYLGSDAGVVFAVAIP